VWVKTNGETITQLQQHVIIIIIIIIITAIRLLPGGGCYFTRKQNMKLVTTKFKLGGLDDLKQNIEPKMTENKTLHPTRPKTKHCTKHDLKQDIEPNMT